MTKTMLIAALATHAMLPASAGSGCGDGGARDEEVAQKIEQRFAQDRSGACVIAAVIEPGAGGRLEAAKAWRCAGARQQALDGDVALEIGSITKTMNGTLLGQLAAEGALRLEDPLAQHAPPGVRVPSFDGAPIRLQHLVTHTSGLPSLPPGLVPEDLTNPYAQLDEAELWAALDQSQLGRAPGARWEYSNFAVMLLSSLVAREGSGRFEDVVRARLFAPLGMTGSYLQTPPPGVRAARGHKVGGAETSAWDFRAATGGVGGVRATMDDMIRYAKAQLGEGDPAVVAMAERSHQRVELGQPRPDGDPEMGLGWIRGELDGRTVVLHDGGTGGFSSIMLVDLQRRRAVVVLADTQLATVGGVEELGLHLLDEAQPLGGPRLPAAPPPALVAALAGSYLLDGTVAVQLEQRGGALWAILAGSGAPTELELAYDSRGDFYPRDHSIDGLLTPVLGDDGRQTFAWVSEGAAVMAERQ